MGMEHGIVGVVGRGTAEAIVGVTNENEEGAGEKLGRDFMHRRRCTEQ